MTRSALLPILLAACSMMSGTALAADVEARLKTGERVFGELLSDDASLVAINRKVWTRNGLIVGRVEYPKKSIDTMETVTSLPDLYQKRAAETPDTFDGQYSLARWCMDRGLQDEAYAHAKKLYDHDPKDEVTRQLLEDLGYVLDDGEWVKRAVYAAKHGMTEYEGKLMTPGQVDLRKAEVKAAYERDAAARKLKVLDNSIAPAEKKITEAGARVDKLRQDLAQCKADEAKAKQGGQGGQGGQGKNKAPVDTSTFVARQKELDKSIAEAQKNVDAANKNAQKARDDAAAGKIALEKAEAAADAAHKAYVESWPTGQVPAAGSAPADAPAKADPAAVPDKAPAKR
jgi:hypothetical protein